MAHKATTAGFYLTQERASVPVIRCRAGEADAAYAAHKALLQAERAAPDLCQIPSFTMAKQDAYERFCRAFERL